MQEGWLPLFPLEVVLFPGMALPLHIFEDRYKEMFAEILALGEPFGVVLAKNNGVLRTGCSAEVAEEMKRYEDGRLDVLTVGTRRFRIVELNTERSFLRGRVEYFVDTEPGPARLDTLHLAVSRLLEWAKAAGTEAPEISLEDEEASFRMAQALPDLDFKQTLLDMVSEQERVEALAEYLAKEKVRQQITAGLKQAAKQNGHGKHLPVE